MGARVIRVQPMAGGRVRLGRVEVAPPCNDPGCRACDAARLLMRAEAERLVRAQLRRERYRRLMR